MEESVLSDLKLLLLDTMSQVVAQEGLTHWAEAIVGLLETLQLLSFCVTHHFSEIWKEVPWQGSLREAIRVVNGTLLTDEALLYLGTAVILLLIVLVILARRREGKGHLAVLALRVLCDLFPAVLYQPLMRSSVLLVTSASMA